MRPADRQQLIRILEAMGPVRWCSAAEIAAEDTCGLSKPTITRMLLNAGSLYVDWREGCVTKGNRTYTVGHWKRKPGALERLLERGKNER